MKNAHIHAQTCLTLRPHRLYVAHQAPLSMVFSRQEYWNRLPLPTPGDLPHSGIEPASFASPTGRFFTTAAPEVIVVQLPRL